MDITQRKLRARVTEPIEPGQVKREIVGNARIVEHTYVFAVGIRETVGHVVVNAAAVDAAVAGQAPGAEKHAEQANVNPKAQAVQTRCRQCRLPSARQGP